MPKFLEKLFYSFLIVDSMVDEFEKQLDECLKILDENVDVLTDIEFELDEEKEDQLVSGMQLHQLYDMTEDVAQSARIKRAQTRFNQRQAQDS